MKTETEPTVDYDAQIAALNLRIAESLSAEKLEKQRNHKAYLESKLRTRRDFAAFRNELSDAVVKLEKEKREAAKAK